MRRLYTVLLLLIAITACRRAPTSTQTARRGGPSAVAPVRATGAVRAVREYAVTVPQIAGSSGKLTVTRILPSGSRVEAGDVLAEFDRTQQEDNARDAAAKLDDLNHQIEQRRAENRSNAESRSSQVQTAEADLSKAQLQLRRGAVISDIERLKNEEKARAARVTLDSLKISHAARERADAAALRILELKRDRQAVALKRAETNVTRLVVKAPLAGMVALESVWRGESRGPAQEGDQIWPGQALLRVFDPSEMEVQTSVGEPDGAALKAGARAVVRLDAYPDLALPAHLLTASPVAVSDLGSPIKRFMARFLIEKSDPRLLPDLSAAVIVGAEAKR